MSLVNIATKGRRQEIKSLVRDHKITPAVAKALEKAFCDDNRVSYALSFESENPQSYGDDFEVVMAALSLNSPVVKAGEQTGAQQSQEHAEQQPIVRNAAARAERAKAFRRR
jgi:hypothetical protein